MRLIPGLTIVLVLTVTAAAQPPANGPAPNSGQPPDAQPAAAQPPADQPVPAEKEEPQPDAKDAPDAPPPPPKKFYQQDPYDVITLDKANENKPLNILPLDLPDRRLPEPAKRVGKIKVRLLENREDEYEVAWRNIEKVEFFGELVLREAAKVVAEAVSLTGASKPAEAQQKYDEAFEFYQFLLRYYSYTPGLQPAVQDYLYLNAGRCFERAVSRKPSRSWRSCTARIGTTTTKADRKPRWRLWSESATG